MIVDPEAHYNYMLDLEEAETHLLLLQSHRTYWRKATLENWNHIIPGSKTVQFMR